MHRLSTNLNRRKRKPYGDEIVLNALFMRHSLKAIRQERCLGYVTGAAIQQCPLSITERILRYERRGRGSIPLEGTNIVSVV